MVYYLQNNGSIFYNIIRITLAHVTYIIQAFGLENEVL